MRSPSRSRSSSAPAPRGRRPATTPRHATTPTSPGPVDPTAIPLGDGYVSSTPKVGYVDSCTTSFGGVGGAQVVGPWIDTATKTWNDATKVAVSGSVTWPAARYSVKVAGRRAHDRVRRPAEPRDRRLPDREHRSRVRVRPEPEPDRAADGELEPAAAPGRGGEAVVPRPRADRRAGRRRVPLRRARRRGPRRRRARGARRVRRPPRHVEQLPPPRRPAVPPRPGAEREGDARRLRPRRLRDLRRQGRDGRAARRTRRSTRATARRARCRGTASRRGSTTTSRRSSTRTRSAATAARRSTSPAARRSRRRRPNVALAEASYLHVARNGRSMPKVGIEPTRPEGHRILSPARLPVPPLRPGR